MNRPTHLVHPSKATAQSRRSSVYRPPKTAYLSSPDVYPPSDRADVSRCRIDSKHSLVGRSSWRRTKSGTIGPASVQCRPSARRAVESAVSRSVGAGEVCANPVVRLVVFVCPLWVRYLVMGIIAGDQILHDTTGFEESDRFSTRQDICESGDPSVGVDCQEPVGFLLVCRKVKGFELVLQSKLLESVSDFVAIG